MHDNFEAISFLTKTLESAQTGRVHIVSDHVEWCLDIADGKLLFAAHSLQYLNTLETLLPSLGYEAALPMYWRLTQLDIYKRQIEQVGLDSLNWTSQIVGALIQYKVLKKEQAEKILAKLVVDATESLLGLEMATVAWHPLPEPWHIGTRGVAINFLVNHLGETHRLWQPMCDRISSPHQRPYCENLSDLYQPIAKGLLSQKMLESLARLMQGASIRQLSQALKQEELKLAQLLYPYIEHRVIKLWPPLAPLDRLPLLPNKPQQPVSFSSHQSPDTKVKSTTANTGIKNTAVSNPINITAAPGANTVQNTRTTAQQSGGDRVVHAVPNPPGDIPPENASLDLSKPRHLIVCIDDSQAMLEKIESYLDPKYFEIHTIIDPVKSVSKICVRKPSLVLMDISMPSINGNSLCSILKRSYMFKDVPIIMISGNVSALNKAKSKVSGAAGYLEKPFSRDQLMDLLNTHLKINIDEFV